MAIEVIVFRYIDPAMAARFSEQLLKLCVEIDEPKESTSPTLWDYPSFSEFAYSTQDVIAACHREAGSEPTLAHLYEVRILTVESPPSHYPYPYVVGFHFRVADFATPSDKAGLLTILSTVTDEVKTYTDTLTFGAKYRPVYWFVTGAPPELRGVRGSIEKVKAPDGITDVEIERGFPHASYIIYDVLPSENDLRLADLALVSVVAHAVERGCRPDLVNKNESIEKVLDRLDNVSLTTSRSSLQLREHLRLVEDAQREIRGHAHSFHETRRNLIRLKGLVQRVRQLGGNASCRTVYDVVCEDAITQIADEVAMSEEQIESGIEAVSDRVSIIHSQINNRYSMLTANRARRLQRIAVMLQSTGIAFVVFQVMERLWNVPEQSALPNNAWCCWAIEPNRVIRATILVIATLAAFFLTRWILKKYVSSKASDSQRLNGYPATAPTTEDQQTHTNPAHVSLPISQAPLANAPAVGDAQARKDPAAPA